MGQHDALGSRYEVACTHVPMNVLLEYNKNNQVSFQLVNQI